MKDDTKGVAFAGEIRLTPCRMRARYLLRVPCTGRSSTGNITALPRVRCTTSAHDCMRRCSVKINSPPVKVSAGGGGGGTLLGSERPIRHTGRGEDNCSRRGRSQQQRGQAGPGVMTAFLKHAKGRWERLREL